jgi:ubiquinone/menaquinone biosynthesis C-methylase UbiE
MIDDDTANKGSKLDNGWDQSAAAWTAELQSGGGARDYVLDAPILSLLRGRGFERAVDVGRGEGRFCRMMQALGIATVGIDPTLALLDQARTLDLQGDHRQGMAERLAFDDGAFNLVVRYLTLIDIADIDAAILKWFGRCAPAARC